jgi:hypothetical protein
VISPDEGQFVVASNVDIELYHIYSSKSSACNFGNSLENFEESIKVKEVKKVKNAHKDSILCLSLMTGKTFIKNNIP